MLCPHCGKEVADSAKYCQFCGAAAVQEAEKPKKKRKKGLWIALAAVAVALGVLGAVTATHASAAAGFFMRTFASPERYLQYVAARNIRAAAERVSEAYGAGMERIPDPGNVSGTGMLEIRLDDALLSLLGAAADTDLTWIDAVRLDYGLSRQGDETAVSLGLGLNGTELLTLAADTDFSGETFAFQVPRFSDRYVTVDAKEYFDAFRSAAGAGADELSDRAAELYRALPDKAVLDRVLVRYLLLLTEHPGDVEKGKDRLRAEGVSADYFTLELTMDERDLRQTVTSLCSALREDGDVREIVGALGTAMERDGLYGEFLDGLGRVLDHADEIELEGDIVLTLWLDKAGLIHGCAAEYDDFRLTCAVPERDGDYGMELCAEQDGGELRLTGSGRRSAESLSGEFDLAFDGESFLSFGVSGLNAEGMLRGAGAGSWSFAPQRGLYLAAGMDAATARSLESLRFLLDIEEAGGGNEGTLRVLWGGEREYVTVRFSGSAGTARAMPDVSDAEELADWLREIAGNGSVSALLADLRTAGVPAEYVDSLEQLSMLALMVYGFGG